MPLFFNESISDCVYSFFEKKDTDNNNFVKKFAATGTSAASSVSEIYNEVCLANIWKKHGSL